MVAASGITMFAACQPIEPRPLPEGPQNSCDVSACDNYEPSSAARPSCSGSGRCEVSGKPEYPFVLAISVPDSSFFASGRTFLLRSQDLRGNSDTCVAPACFLLPPLVEVGGEYRVAGSTPALVGYPLSGTDVLPARVAYFPAIALDDGTLRDAGEVGLPSAPLFADTVPTAAGTRFLAFAPFGQYLREAMPTRPFDAAFPPVVGPVSVTVEGVRERIIPFFTDSFAVGAPPSSLDDPSGSAHTAFVKRAAGLDGFYTYLRDRKTERRLSSLRPLAGLDAAVRLDTVGQNGPAGALREGIDIVVMPDARWVGMPTLVDRILAGAGFRLEYPDLPSPVSVTGQVDAEGAAAAQVTFVSTRIDVRTPTPSDLVYRTTVRTDAEGRFATVLPPGNYDAFVEPDDRAFAKTRVSTGISATERVVVLRAPRKGVVSGKVRIADGRALSNADVLWGPSVSRRSLSTPWLSPRPGRARTDAEGRYSVALDEGDYDVTVVPQAGSGFPRFVAPRRPVGPNDATLDDLVIVAPTRVAFTMLSPGVQAIGRAVVRAFAFVPSLSGFVEVGQALSDTRGQFELLLGPLPK